VIISRGLGAPQFNNHVAAVAYLRRLAQDPQDRLAMRRAVAGDRPIPGLSDDDVLRMLAWRLVRGEIQVLGDEPGGGGAFWSPSAAGTSGGAGSSAAASEPGAVTVGSDPPPAAAAAPATTGATAPMREQEAAAEDAAVLPEECDEAAQAETLAAASEAGTPFCEV